MFLKFLGGKEKKLLNFLGLRVHFTYLTYQKNPCIHEPNYAYQVAFLCKSSPCHLPPATCHTMHISYLLLFLFLKTFLMWHNRECSCCKVSSAASLESLVCAFFGHQLLNSFVKKKAIFFKMMIFPPSWSVLIRKRSFNLNSSLFDCLYIVW